MFSLFPGNSLVEVVMGFNATFIASCVRTIYLKVSGYYTVELTVERHIKAENCLIIHLVLTSLVTVEKYFAPGFVATQCDTLLFPLFPWVYFGITWRNYVSY